MYELTGVSSTVLANVQSSLQSVQGRNRRDCGSEKLVENIHHGVVDAGGGTLISEPGSFEISCPKRSVSDELDMASETFSRKLRSLREKGYIKVSRSQIEILDPEDLRGIASEER